MTANTLPQLRPLRLGQLLDQAIRLYRRNFLKFIGIIAVVQIPLSIMQLISGLLTTNGFFQFASPSESSSLEQFNASFYLGIAGTLITALLGFVLLQVVATAALTRAVAASYLGDPIGITDAYRSIGRSWVSLLGAFLIGLIIIIGLLIWTLVPCVGWLTGVGMVVFFGAVVMPLIAPVIVLEQQNAFGSIRRAWDLTRRRFWWVIGFVFILYLFAQIIITGPVMLFALLANIITGADPLTQSIMQTVVQTVVQVVASLIYLPLQLTAITLMYFDLRVRTEGFDLTLLAESTSATSSDITEMTTQAPKPERGNLLTMTEMGYFVLIEIGAVALYFAIIFIVMAVVLSFGAAAGGF